MRGVQYYPNDRRRLEGVRLHSQCHARKVLYERFALDHFVLDTVDVAYENYPPISLDIAVLTEEIIPCKKVLLQDVRCVQTDLENQNRVATVIVDVAVDRSGFGMG